MPPALQPKSLDVVSLMVVGQAKHAGLWSGLRTARFHPRGFPQNRLLHHMLATPEKVILLTPLRRFDGDFPGTGEVDE